MKRAHIVYAHPEPKSFVAAMRDTTARVLTEQGYAVTVSDLYAMNFNPVAGAHEFNNRRDPQYLSYALEQRHAVETHTVAEDVESEATKVIESDLLVLVFPVYWYSVPAILKGWIDRVFLSGRFYGGRRIYDAGPMRGKRALVVTSLGGRAHMFEGPDSMHGDLHTMLRHLLQGTLSYVGFDVMKPFIGFHVPYLGDQERKAILGELEEHLRNLDALPVLPRPTLADFDSTFRPKAQAVKETSV